jgi:cysteine desulfurase
MMEELIYADNSATTPVSAAALEAMLPLFSVSYGNPSAIYSLGREAKKSLEESRRRVADALGARNNEIFFTSGGTEGDNWAIFSVCEQYVTRGKLAGRGRHIISTKIEHSAVLKALEKLAIQGFEVTLLEPSRNGMISPDDLRSAIREDTILVSVMMANNVTGALLPIKGLCDVAHEHKILFHTDAVQAAGHIPINVREIGVDLLSISAHKFHGPKGVGALYARVPLIPNPLLFGGGQEKGRRSGTENVPLIAGMAAALEEGVRAMDENTRTITALRDALIAGVLAIPGAHLTGDPVRRLPGLASFVFEGLEGAEGQNLVLLLDEAGICVSSGSACSVGSIDPPAPLLAMGYEPKLARSALRISLSAGNTEAEVDRIVAALPGIVQKARNAGT